MAKRKLKQRADGRYQSQIYLGTENGKRIVKTVYGKTMQELEENEREIRVKLKKGFNLMEDKKTFGSWVKVWLEEKEMTVSNGRYVNYKSAIEKFYPLYSTRLEKLYSIDFQRIINRWATKNEVTGKPSSKASLEEMKRAASQVYKLAIDNRVTEFNPLTGVKIKAVQSQTSRRALTEEEQRWIRETPHRAQMAAMIMMYAGLRRGELIPLKWNDIDFQENTISVTKSVEKINGHFELKDGAKSENGVRVIPMPDILSSYLREKKKEAASIFVCPKAKGQMMTESAFRRMWESYLVELNFRYGDFSAYGGRKNSVHDPEGVPMVIERFTPHYLRHTYASILFMSGVDVMTAKELMGHADIETMLGIYTHLSKTYKKKEISKLNEYLAENQ